MAVWTCLLETEVRLHVSFHHGLTTNVAHPFCFPELVFGFADVAQDKIIQIYKKQTNNLLGFTRCFSLKAVKKKKQNATSSNSLFIRPNYNFIFYFQCKITFFKFLKNSDQYVGASIKMK